MSSDPQSLSALAMKTESPMRYFELVKIANGGYRKKCFVAVGKHELHFLRQNWDDLIHAAGVVPFAHVDKVLVDSNSRSHLMLVLNGNRSPEWASERLYIDSEHRMLFLRHFRCCWQTDLMWRTGKVRSCPCSNFALTNGEVLIPAAMPFLGWMWKEHCDYRFMVPQSYEDKANAIQQTDTGEYECCIDGCSLVVHVHELKTIFQSKCLAIDHVRWVALQYKRNLLEDESQFYVLRNAPYNKRMNLGGDTAQWSGWEVIIRIKEVTMIAVLLRRQYLPPVCNNVQDIVMLMRCPQRTVMTAEALAQKVRNTHLMADSLTSGSTTFSVYREVVQSKLDALRFDDSGVSWLRAYLKLSPQGGCGRRQAKTALRMILKIYIDDSAYDDQEDILNSAPEGVIVNGEPGEAWANIEHVNVQQYIKSLRYGQNCGLPDENDVPEGFDKFKHEVQCEIVRNQWMVRVARYMAWAFDGGMLGTRFDLETMTGGLTILGEKNYALCQWIISFLLHMRSRNMKEPFDEAVAIVTKLRTYKFDNSFPYSKESCLDCYTFNENVMMVLLRSGYISKFVFGEHRRDEYLATLGSLLTQGCGIDLKAFICRLFMEGSTKMTTEAAEPLINPLVHLLQSGIPFLATYASAALVNMSHGNESIKVKMLSVGIASLVCKQLKAKDDDLICYVLMLLVNLTKEAHHRAIMHDQGLSTMIYDILTSTYHQGASLKSGAVGLPGANTIKVKILTQVCIIIGQFANEPQYRKEYQTVFEHTVPCLVYIYMQGDPVTSLACKAVFALKQVCVDHGRHKMYICSHMLRKIVEELFDPKLEKSIDFYNQAILLLQAMANSKECVVMFESADLTTDRLMDVLDDRNNKLVQANIDLQQRIESLAVAISNMTSAMV